MSVKDNLLGSVKRFKRKSIFIKNLRLIALLMMIPLLWVSAVLYFHITSVTFSEAENTNRASLVHTSDLCDLIISDACRIAASGMLDRDVNMAILSEFDMMGMNEADNIISRVNKFISSYTLIYDHIDSIYIYSKKNNYIISNQGNSSVDDFSDTDWLNHCLNSSTDKDIIIPRIRNGVYPYYMSIIRPVVYDGSTVMGAVVVNIDLKKLRDMIWLKENPYLQNLFIAGEDGRLYYSNDISQVMTSVSDTDYLDKAMKKDSGFSGQINANGKKYLVSVLDSKKGYNFRYISVTPYSYYHSILVPMVIDILLVILFAFIIEFILSLFISARTYRPLSNIFSMLNDDEAIKSSDSFDELEFVKESIVKTMSSKKRADAELAERLEMLNNTQIAALQAQINPHFLYNTLEAINWMAEELTDGSNEVTRAILSLSKLLHMYTESDFYLVTLRQELDYALLYVDILKSRYGDMFKLEVDFPQEMLDMVVIKFCLQPVIENAIQHGIRPSGENGIIRISGKLNGDKMEIFVSDNGVGMTEEALTKINEEMCEKYTWRQKNIGIHNVNQRIRLAFGETYGISLFHNEPHGITVMITMPYNDAN